MSDDFFNELNQQQKEAVSYINGPSIILAGAGSGKTRVLVYKVLNLIKNQHVSPLQIVMITFTNKAANEMKKRLGLQRLGYIGTFHSFCCQILRREGHQIDIDHDFIIYDQDDQISLIKKVIKNLEVKKYSPAYFLKRISAAKNQLITPERYLEMFSDYNVSLVTEVYKNYQKELRKNKALDFDDLIVEVVNLFRQQQDFPEAKIFHLEQNYRSTQTILDFAYKIIAKNNTHPILNLFTSNKEGDEVEFYEAEDEQEEAVYVANKILNLFVNKQIDFPKHSSFAVLYRTNAQSRIIEEAFLHYSLPYVLVGGTRFYERKEIKDVLSYLRLVANFEDEISKDRIKKLGKKRFEQFLNFVKKNKSLKDID